MWVEVLINNQLSPSDQQKILDGYKSEVNEKLNNLGINIMTMTDFLPLQLPFDVPIPVPIVEKRIPEIQNPDPIKE